MGLAPRVPSASSLPALAEGAPRARPARDPAFVYDYEDATVPGAFDPIEDKYRALARDADRALVDRARRRGNSASSFGSPAGAGGRRAGPPHPQAASSRTRNGAPSREYARQSRRSRTNDPCRLKSLPP